MTPIVWYILAEIACVITNTISKVVVVKGSKMAAAVTATVYHTISALVTFLVGRMAELNIWVILVTTVAANFVGTIIGLLLLESLKKDILLRVSATVHSDDYDSLIGELLANGYKFVTFKTDWEKVKLIDVFSTKRSKSKKLGEIFRKYKVKYTINNNNNRL